MSSGRKVRVAVLFGGRSGEHEVSLRSAASVIRHLDKTRFEVVPIGIDKQGRWHLNDVGLIEEAMRNPVLPMHMDAPDVVLPPNPGAQGTALLALGGSRAPAERSSGASAATVDVVFPVMHGTYCEDGTIQGLLELADVAYVGCGVLSSAVGMDKEVAKRLARDAGIPIVPYVSLKAGDWKRKRAEIEARVAKELGFPCFVKPSNSGSSVGVHKVKEPGALAAAVEDALKYDLKVLVEKAIDAREIEISALENPREGEPPLVSVTGEVAPTGQHEFYSYESKYLDDNGAALMIPAKVTPEQQAEIQRIAREVFVALECEGMARIDFFLDKKTGKIWFNEINTLPGFTSISMYPKMWEASGLPYSELLSKLVELAMARQDRKRGLVRDFHAK